MWFNLANAIKRQTVDSLFDKWFAAVYLEIRLGVGLTFNSNGLHGDSCFCCLTLGLIFCFFSQRSFVLQEMAVMYVRCVDKMKTPTLPRPQSRSSPIQLTLCCGKTELQLVIITQLMTALLINFLYFFIPNQVYIRGIKHDFPFINIRKVPREVLKTSRGTLRMLMNDKIMFDRYYCINCINSTKHCENEGNIDALYFITSSHLPTFTIFFTSLFVFAQ